MKMYDSSIQILVTSTFMTNNHVAAITDKDEVPREFHPIMDFMMASPLNHALTADPIINMDAVTQAGPQRWWLTLFRVS